MLHGNNIPAEAIERCTNDTWSITDGMQPTASCFHLCVTFKMLRVCFGVACVLGPVAFTIHCTYVLRHVAFTMHTFRGALHLQCIRFVRCIYMYYVYVSGCVAFTMYMYAIWDVSHYYTMYVFGARLFFHNQASIDK